MDPYDSPVKMTMHPYLVTALLGLSLISIPAFGHPDPNTPPGEDHAHPVFTGSGDYQFEAFSGWGELPDGKMIGPTHGGVVVDPQTGLIYVSTNAPHSILVYRPDGTLERTIAPQMRGFHAMDAALEAGKTVIYGALLNKQHPRVCKIDTDGNLLLVLSAESHPDLPGGWKGITGVAVAPDGSIFCSMGYGSNVIHKFAADGSYIKSFGGKGKGAQVLTQTSHGLKVDKRFDPARLLVCDRENRRLFHTTLDGEWIGEIATDLRRPCAVSILGDLCAIAELEGRVTILDKAGHILTHLGDNPDKAQWAKFKVELEDIPHGLFTAPHGLSFDQDGNLYVQDWNRSGRLTKLVRK